MEDPAYPPFPWHRLFATVVFVSAFIAGVTKTSIGELAHHGPRIDHRVLAVHAVSDGSAIVVWKDRLTNEDWVSRYDANGERWRRRVPGEARYISGTEERNAIGVGSDFFVVQYIEPRWSYIQLAAFELDDGALRWATFLEAPTFYEGKVERHPSAKLMDVDDAVIVSLKDGWARIDPRTTRMTRTTRNLQGASEIARGAVHERFVAHTVAPGREWSVWCEFQGGTVYVDRVEHGEVLDTILRIENGGRSREVFVGDTGYVERCAAHGDDIVLFQLGLGRRPGEESRFVLVDAYGRGARAIVMSRLLAWPASNRALDPMAGELPRFVPATVARHDKYFVDIIDLETGTVIAGKREMQIPSTMRVGTQWIRLDPRWSNASLLESIDGDTGATVAALAVAYVPLKPQQAAGGYLWLFEEYRDTISLARIELATMRVDFKRGHVWIAHQNVGDNAE